MLATLFWLFVAFLCYGNAFRAVHFILLPRGVISIAPVGFFFTSLLWSAALGSLLFFPLFWIGHHGF